MLLTQSLSFIQEVQYVTDNRGETENNINNR